MGDSKLYSVMVEVNIQADSLDDANDKIDGWLTLYQPRMPKGTLKASVLYDYETDNANNRVFYNHPADVDAEFDPDEYEEQLEARRSARDEE